MSLDLVFKIKAMFFIFRGMLSAIELLGFTTLPLGLAAAHPSTEPEIVDKLKRTGSERFKDGAKAFLKKVESVKASKKKRPHLNKEVIIKEPNQLTLFDFNQRLSDKKARNIKASRSNPSSPMPTSPLHTPTQGFMDFSGKNKLELYSPNHLSPAHFPVVVRKKPEKKFVLSKKEKLKETKSGDDSSSYCSESSQESASNLRTEKNKLSLKKPSRVRRFLQRSQKPDDTGALSDSECHVMKSSFVKLVQKSKDDSAMPKISRCGSLNLGRDSGSARESLQKRTSRSFRVKGQKEDEEKIFKRKTKIVKWHSFQKGTRPESLTGPQRPMMRRKSSTCGFSLNSMSCGQLQVRDFT